MKRVKTTFGRDILQNPDILTNPERYIIAKRVYDHRWSLREVLLDMMSVDCILVVDGELVRARDIRCDYRSREVYALYLKGTYVPIPNAYVSRFQEQELDCKYFGYRLPINQHLEKYVIWDGDYKVKQLYALWRDTNGKFGVIEIDLSWLVDLTPDGNGNRLATDARNLFLKGMRMSYGYHNENAQHLYWTNEEKYLSKTEKLAYAYIARRVPSIRRMGNYREVNYRDISPNSVSELMSIFTVEELKEGTSYAMRRLDFEMTVLEHWYYSVYWYGWTKSNCQNLLSGKHYFCKYSEGKFALVMQSEWILPVNRR